MTDFLESDRENQRLYALRASEWRDDVNNLLTSLQPPVGIKANPYIGGSFFSYDYDFTNDLYGREIAKKLNEDYFATLIARDNLVFPEFIEDDGSPCDGETQSAAGSEKKKKAMTLDEYKKLVEEYTQKREALDEFAAQIFKTMTVMNQYLQYGDMENSRRYMDFLYETLFQLQ